MPAFTIIREIEIGVTYNEDGGVSYEILTDMQELAVDASKDHRENEREEERLKNLGF
jgi:hypothetical protein